MYPSFEHDYMAFGSCVCEEWRFVHKMNDEQNQNTGTDTPVSTDDQATPAPAEGDAPVAETPAEEKPAEETPAA